MHPLASTMVRKHSAWPNKIAYKLPSKTWAHLQHYEAPRQDISHVIPHFVAHMWSTSFAISYIYSYVATTSPLHFLLYIPWWWAIVTCQSSVYMVYDVIYHWWWMRLLYGCLHLISVQIDTFIYSFIFRFEDALIKISLGHVYARVNLH